MHLLIIFMYLTFKMKAFYLYQSNSYSCTVTFTWAKDPTTTFTADFTLQVHLDRCQTVKLSKLTFLISFWTATLHAAKNKTSREIMTLIYSFNRLA